MGVMRAGGADVVVTGMAMTTSLRDSAEGTWRALLDGESGIRTLEDPFVEEYDLPVRIGGHLVEDVDEHLTPAELTRWSYVQRLAVVLGRRVWTHAGTPAVDTRRLAVSIGTGMGGSEMLVYAYDDLHAYGPGAVSPHVVSQYTPNGPAAAVALDHRARAGVFAPASACASSSEAIVQAWRHLVTGEADIAICGGIESKIVAVPIAAFAQMRIVLSKNNDDPAGACRPFDRDRDGFVFGEGGALLVLETERHATARGAHIIGRLLGGAVTSDGHHMVAPDPSGQRAAFAMTRAIQLAGLTSREVDHVNAHATGTGVGDLAESVAINIAMGPGHRPAVYAAKGALGHCVGAAGAVESILTLQALRDGLIPATRNLKNLDPAADLDVVAGSPRPGDYQYAVSNSFGFGGHNVALVYGRP
jgi:beta-ketoacyl ACP synthase